MRFIFLFIFLVSCLAKDRFKEKEKMEVMGAVAAISAISAVCKQPEVKKFIDDKSKLLKLSYEWAATKLDERFFRHVEDAIEDTKERKELRNLIKAIKESNKESILNSLNKKDKEKSLINLNKTIPINEEETTCANLILLGGCYNDLILDKIIESLPIKNSKGMHPIHLGCIFGLKDLVEKLIEKDKDCLKYVSDKLKGIKMNGLAYAAMFDCYNLILHLFENNILEDKAEINEGYIISIMLSNNNIRDLFKKIFYGTGEEKEKEKEKENLRKKIRDLGMKNNVFHILPQIKNLKSYSNLGVEQNPTLSEIGNIPIIEEKYNGYLVSNLIGELEWLGFGKEEILKLLAEKNSDGRTVGEIALLCGEEELIFILYKVVIKEACQLAKEEDTPEILEIAKPMLGILDNFLSLSIERRYIEGVGWILEIFSMVPNLVDGDTSIISVVTQAISKAVEEGANEILFLLYRFMEQKGENINPELLEKIEGDDFLNHLQRGSRNMTEKDFAFRALKDISYKGRINDLKMEGGYCKRSILLHAVHFGNMPLVKSIITQIENSDSFEEILFQEDVIGKTVFHISCENNCISILNYLLARCREKGISNESALSARLLDKKGNSPLHYVKSIDLLTEVKKLLGDNEFIKTCRHKNKYGKNVLMKYVSDIDPRGAKKLKLVKLLLKDYDYSSVDKEGKSLEMLMIESNDQFFSPCLKTMFEKREFDMSRQDNSGNKLLHYVAKHSKKGTCLDLIRNKQTYFDLLKKENKEGCTPEQLAVDEDNSLVLLAMLEKKGGVEQIKGKRRMERDFKEKLSSLIDRAKSKNKKSVISALINIGRVNSVKELFENSNLDYWGVMEAGVDCNQVPTIKKLLEIKGKLPSDIDGKLKSILFRALEKGSMEIASLIVRNYKEKVVTRESNKIVVFDLLVKAIEKNEDDFVRDLLGVEAIKNELISYKRDDKKIGLLGDACYFGRNDLVELLIQSGADVNSNRIQNEPVLHLVAHQGYRRLCKILIDNGADVNAKNSKGLTALMISAEKGDKEVCKILIKNKAGINIEGNRRLTALMLAAEKGHNEVCKFLIDNGAKINSEDSKGLTALMLAAQEGHKEVCEILIENKANINAKNLERSTALMLAAEEGHNEVCKLLIDDGADINAKNSKGLTALMLAVKKRNKDVCSSILLSEKLTVNAKGSQEATALHFSSESGSKDICEMLIKKGAIIDLQNKENMTPLHLASKNGKEDVCKLLIDREAKTDIKDKNGNTPKDYLRENGLFHLIKGEEANQQDKTASKIFCISTYICLFLAMIWIFL
tara:strand:+ start:374 stop:4264 length:3891 start_codon:yes stop_codon:yes gene_type:complete